MAKLTAAALLSKLNKKLGRNVRSWSILAGEACPGATAACLDVCYAGRMQTKGLHAKGIHKGWKARLELAQSDPEAFEALMGKALSRLAPGTPVRIHVSGDFFSASYAMIWRRLIKANPGLRFWAYTRSYRAAEVWPVLSCLQSLPNLTLFASCDADAPTSQAPKGWRTAVMGGACPTGHVTCPEIAGKVESCEACGLCFKPGVKVGIHFPIH